MPRMANWTQPQSCPDCAREGQVSILPPDRFYYYIQQARGGTIRRSAYCIPHTLQRNQAWRIRKKPPAE